MAAVARVKIAWAGFQGAPGFTIFHFKNFTNEGITAAETADAAARTDAWLASVSGVLPGNVTVQVQQDVEIIQHDTGELLDVLSGPTTPLRFRAGGSSIGLVGPAGAVINWRTAVVRNKRRMRGRTFIVPLGVDQFEQNGTLTGSCVDTLTNASNTLKDSTGVLDFGVYGRPTPILDDAGKKTGEYNADGIFAPVRACNVPDMAAVLRSRRD